MKTKKKPSLKATRAKICFHHNNQYKRCPFCKHANKIKTITSVFSRFYVEKFCRRLENMSQDCIDTAMSSLHEDARMMSLMFPSVSLDVNTVEVDKKVVEVDEEEIREGQSDLDVNKKKDAAAEVDKDGLTVDVGSEVDEEEYDRLTIDVVSEEKDEVDDEEYDTLMVDAGSEENAEVDEEEYAYSSVRKDYEAQLSRPNSRILVEKLKKQELEEMNDQLCALDLEEWAQQGEPPS